MPTLNAELEVYFRDNLRDARAQVLRDSEDFDDVIQVLEQLGQFLKGSQGAGLGSYRSELETQASRSDFASKIPTEWPGLHMPFANLFDVVKSGRNQAIHQGIYARNLASTATDLALLIEDSLVQPSDKIERFMVKEVICAHGWQPLSFIRSIMLKNSFSYLPVCLNDEWRLVADYELAKYLETDRPQGLVQTLEQAYSKGNSQGELLTLPAATTERPHATKAAVLNPTGKSNQVEPVLITDKANHLLGIVTAFDLL